MAKTLVEQMSEAWKPSRYTDDYKSALMKLIDKKIAAGGKSIPGKEPTQKSATNVIDLAAMLEESLAEASGGKPKAKAAKGKKSKSKSPGKAA
jgi:DNA end-binding protein Ku